MIIRVRGYNSGFAEYLRTGMKQGNKLHRDELDSRVVLYGDLDVTNKIVNAMPDKGSDRYLHITLSFKEDFITDEQLKGIVSDFQKRFMNAYDVQEYAFYAEAHLPKIKSLLNESTGEMESRKPHIHIIIPKTNLIDGSYLNPIGYYEHNEKYIEAIQEDINFKYNLASPRDNRRTFINDTADLISRYKGDLFKTDSRGVKEKLLTLIMENETLDYDKFMSTLTSMGEIKERKGKNGNYLNILPTGMAKGVNLKEFVFSKEFLDKDIDAKKNDLIRMFASRDHTTIKKDKKKYDALLVEWLHYRSHEIKHLHPNSTEFKLYKKMSLSDKEMYIQNKISLSNEHINASIISAEHVTLSHLIADELNRKYHVGKKDRNQKPSIPGYANQRNVRAYDRDGRTIQRYSMRQLQRSKLDTSVFERATMFLQSDARNSVEVKREEFSGDMRFAIDRTDAGTTTRGMNKQLTNSNWGLEVEYIPERISFKPVSLNRNNYVETLKQQLANIDIQSIDVKKDNWKLIQRHTNAFTLLSALEHSHGIEKEKYYVVKGKDGNDRIKTDKRAFSVNDFLTKELNFTWAEAKNYLITEFERQRDNGELRLKVTPSVDFWTQYKDHISQNNNSYSSHLKQLRDKQRREIFEFHRSYRDKSRSIWNLQTSYRDKAAFLAALRLEKMEKKEILLSKLQKEKHEFTLKMRTQNRYTSFLREKAEEGNSYALEELRRYTSAIKERDSDNCFTFAGGDAQTIIFTDITFKVKSNGNVNYFIGSKLVVEDSKEWVILKETDNKQAVEFAIKLAIEKNGNKPLTLSGDEIFKKSIVTIAAEQKLNVTFSEPVLQQLFEELRHQRQESQSTQERTTPAPRK